MADAPLHLAELRRQAIGLSNLHFQSADAHHLPFARAEFDAVVCRFAFHHFANPVAVLDEMARVCRTGGTVAVEDLVVSEHRDRAAYQNRVENVRDPSHTLAFPLSTLLTLFTAAGLAVQQVYTDHRMPVVEQWLQCAQPLPERAAEARRLLEQDEVADQSGTRPFRHAAGELCFVQRTAMIAGRKLGR